MVAEVEQFPPVGQFAPVLAVSEKSVPVPVRETECGLPLALSVTVTEAERVPVAEGLKVTLMMQLAPAATPVPQVSVSEKSLVSAPVMVVLEIIRAALPVFFRVTFCGGVLLVPTS
jgi:hypothetical protein